MKNVASLAYVNELIKSGEFKVKKTLGQNFIIEKGVVEKIARLACDQSHSTIEIGPGLGALSQYLAQYSKSLIAYELDLKVIPFLKANLSEFNNVEIKHQDFLKADFSQLTEEYVVCANLPYYITTPILFKLAKSPLKIKSINVMMQKEVGLRILAGAKTSDYGALSVIMQSLFEIKKLMDVKADVFYPRPKVASIVLSFIPKNPYDEAYFDFIFACFKWRRKTLYNNLKDYLEKEKLAELEKILPLKTYRAQELTQAQLKGLYDASL